MERGSVSAWLSGVKKGDSVTRGRLFGRFHGRAVALAEQQLKGTPCGEADAEDVAGWAMFEFFKRAAEDGFACLESRQDLWQILAMLIVRTAIDHKRRAGRGKKGKVVNEAMLAGTDSESEVGLDRFAAAGPTPDSVVAADEMYQRLIDYLGEDTLRVVAVMSLEGHTNEEIARELKVTVRTVERKLRQIRELWEQWRP